MRRQVVAIVVAGAALVAGAACGDDGGGATSSTTNADPRAEYADRLGAVGYLEAHPSVDPDELADFVEGYCADLEVADDPQSDLEIFLGINRANSTMELDALVVGFDVFCPEWNDELALALGR